MSQTVGQLINPTRKPVTPKKRSQSFTAGIQHSSMSNNSKGGGSNSNRVQFTDTDTDTPEPGGQARLEPERHSAEPRVRLHPKGSTSPKVRFQAQVGGT